MNKTQEFRDVENMDFEQAFIALQENVKKLEGEELSLEESLALYKRGQALAKHCADLLEKAELEVQTLALGAAPSSQNPD